MTGVIKKHARKNHTIGNVKVDPLIIGMLEILY